MTNEEAQLLLEKYNAGQCTEAEKALLEDWFLSYNEHPIDISDDRIKEIGEEIYANLPIHQRQKNLTLWKGLTAIAAVTLLSVLTWHLFDRVIRPKENNIVKDISPGGKKATLSSSDGKKLELNGDKNGIAINGSDISYTDGSAIANPSPTPVHRLTTPNGGEYQIVLADGTKVWLNAASSLTFPTSFADKNERLVHLTGEAYFEVSKHKSKNGRNIPFFVSTMAQKVAVLGTHFNINSYGENNPTITTLLEGSVSVTVDPTKPVILKPGQQALAQGNKIKVQTADMETAMAWKNGRMEFKDANLYTIMEQVSRWYDIKVEYKGDFSKRTFNGSISRNSNLSVLLKILRYSDVSFELVHDKETNTNKLTVKP